jgi:hypothetical protein
MEKCCPRIGRGFSATMTVRINQGESSSFFMLSQKINRVHCKKRLAVFPSPAGMSLTKLSLWPEIIKLSPSRENLVNDMPAGDGKTANPFLTVYRYAPSIAGGIIIVNVKKIESKLFFLLSEKI